MSPEDQDLAWLSTDSRLGCKYSFLANLLGLLDHLLGSAIFQNLANLWLQGFVPMHHRCDQLSLDSESHAQNFDDRDHEACS